LKKKKLLLDEKKHSPRATIRGDLYRGKKPSGAAGGFVRIQKRGPINV